ncbi:extensin-like [Corapipo altera]|uniref:extensin-like n=1 Tax=Corapipo altera TaxID=415028 RepID=UPI000FD6A456|nr:extensin-like [Corapipo altera]
MSHPSLFCSFITHLTQPSPPSCHPPSPSTPFHLPVLHHLPYPIPSPVCLLLCPTLPSAAPPLSTYPSFLCCHPLCPIPPCHPPPSPTRSHLSFLCSSISQHVLSLLPVLLHPPSCPIPLCAPLSPMTSYPSTSHPSFLMFQSVLSAVSHPSLPCYAPPLPTVSPPTLPASWEDTLHLLPPCSSPPPTISDPCFLCSSTALHIHLPVFLSHLHPIPLTCSSFIHHTLFLVIFIHLHHLLMSSLPSSPPPCYPSSSCFASSFPYSCQHLTISSSAPTMSSTSYHHPVPAYPPLAPTSTPTCPTSSTLHFLHTFLHPLLSLPISSLNFLHFPIPKSTLTPHHFSISSTASPKFAFCSSTLTFPIPPLCFSISHHLLIHPTPLPSSLYFLLSLRCLFITPVTLIHIPVSSSSLNSLFLFIVLSTISHTFSLILHLILLIPPPQSLSLSFL